MCPAADGNNDMNEDAPERALAGLFQAEGLTEKAKTRQDRADLLLTSGAVKRLETQAGQDPDIETNDPNPEAEPQSLFAELESLSELETATSWLHQAEILEHLLARLPGTGEDRIVEARAHLSAHLALVLQKLGESGSVENWKRSQDLYDEALTVFRSHERWLEVAETAHNKATLLVKLFESGEAIAAVEARALYDEALEIRRSHKRWLEVAATAQNKAILLLRLFEGGEATAAVEARALYDEALEQAEFSLVPVLNLQIRNNFLILMQYQGDHSGIIDLTMSMINDVQQRLPTLSDLSSRRTLLRAIQGLGQRGAVAVLENKADAAKAISMLESGRILELGLRLRQAEAALDPKARMRLDALRQDLAAARQDHDAALKALHHEDQPAALGHAHLKKTRTRLDSANTDFAGLCADLQLDRAASVPSPAALRTALGPQTSLALMLSGAQDDGYWLLLSPGKADWRVVPVPGFGNTALGNLMTDWFDAYDAFLQALAVGDPHYSGKKAFSAAIETHQARLWTLLMGPLHQALQDQGQSPAQKAETAPEVVICPLPWLSALPLATARNPESGTWFLEDYAVRMVPSLNACLTASSRAGRRALAPLLAVTTPQDDLGPEGNPALDLFAAGDRRELHGYRGEPQQQHLATAKNLIQAVAAHPPGCFSFFGHGSWDSGDIEKSGLWLAAPPDAKGNIPTEPFGPSDRRTKGDAFTVAQLAALDLGQCRFAVLAGCETGLIDLKNNPDEFIGLPAALLEAGAAGVLATLWPVPAAPTRTIIRAVLSDMMQNSSSPVQALRRAQMAALFPGPSSHDNRSAWFWAGYIMAGQ